MCLHSTSSLRIDIGCERATMSACSGDYGKLLNTACPDESTLVCVYRILNFDLQYKTIEMRGRHHAL